MKRHLLRSGNLSWSPYFLAKASLGIYFLIIVSEYFIISKTLDQHILPTPPPTSSLVKYGDKIYTMNYADKQQSPIVVPAYRLVIFTVPKVGCTLFKMLARRMSGIADYDTTKIYNGRLFQNSFLSNPGLNGLTYLYNLDLSTANEAMTSPNWTRAIFVRDPKSRFLSAYLDKVVSERGFLHRYCCPYTNDCESGRSTLSAFFRIASKCQEIHWVPQSHRMEAKYWEYINFVGHIENAQQDAERLLRTVGMGAWEKFGKSGWGSEGTGSIFSENEKTSPGTHHATNASKKLQDYYTPELERLVEEFYEADYDNPVLQLERRKIFV